MIGKSSRFKGQNEINIILIIIKQVGKVDSPHKEKNTNHILFKKKKMSRGLWRQKYLYIVILLLDLKV